MGKTIKKVASIAAPILGGAVGGPVGAAIGGAVSGGISGGGLKGVGLGAIKGYAGNVIGSSIGNSLSGSLGKVGSTSIGSLTSKNTMGPFSFGDIGSAAGNTIGNTLANTTIGQAAGSFAGNSIAGSLTDSLFPQDAENSEPGQPAPFSPSRQAQIDFGGNIPGFNSLTPDQQSSNLATQGVYGGGLGGEEQGYFLNQLNRKLVDDAGNVDQDLSEVSPIESSYLAQLGLGGYNNSRSLLEAISKWKAA